MLLKDSSKWFNYSQEKEKRKEKTTERKRHEGDGNVDSPSTPATPTSAAGSTLMIYHQLEMKHLNYYDPVGGSLRRKHVGTKMFNQIVRTYS